MVVIGRSKTGIYISKGTTFKLVYLDHSAEQISNDFYSLPYFNTIDEAQFAFPELEYIN